MNPTLARWAAVAAFALIVAALLVATRIIRTRATKRQLREHVQANPDRFPRLNQLILDAESNDRPLDGL